MAWNPFPYPETSYAYMPSELKKKWPFLHNGDLELFPQDPLLVNAWVDFHAGQFERAARAGIDRGVDGYSVANKATCIYAHYLEDSNDQKMALYEAVVRRCERQQRQQPRNPAGYYWHAYALARYAQCISVVKALQMGIGRTIDQCLDRTLKLAPQHADAHVAMGIYHSEVVDKVGKLAGAFTYGASKFAAMAHFRTSLYLNPDSAIARIEYANALLMLDGDKQREKAISLCERAAAQLPHDAMEQLDVDLAREELAA